MATNSNDYYQKKIKEGQEYQDFISDILLKEGIAIRNYVSEKYQYNVGENKAGFEIKYDNRYKETGNLYIEIAEKTNPNNLEYFPSGIYRNDNTWLYLIGDYREIYIFARRTLLEKEFDFHHTENERYTSKGFLIPKLQAEQLAIKKITPE